MRGIQCTGQQRESCVTVSSFVDRQVHGQRHLRRPAILTDNELVKQPPEVITVHSAPSEAGGQKPTTDSEKIPIDPCCEIIIRRLRHAFQRDPDTGSLFGRLSPRRMLVVFCAELLGTALLLFMGCMVTVSGVVCPTDAPTSLQVSLGFGLTVASIIQIIGHISVAHINPAVTLCAVLRDDLNVPAAGVYFLAQTIGAVLGFGFLLSVTPSSAVCECLTVPAASLSPLQAVLVEAGATAVLILLCHGCWDARNAKNTDSTPLKFGFLVAAVAMTAGPYTGGSMNPVRTLAPAIWKNVWTHHWVYWVGPFAGSAIASLLYLTVFDERPSTSSASRNRRCVENNTVDGTGAVSEKAESIPLN